MTLIMSSIHTYLAGARGQTIVLALSREYKWGFSFHVSGSHRVRRDSSVMWEFLGALSLCSAFFIDFLWPHILSNPSATNCLPIIGIWEQQRPLHNYLLDAYLVEMALC